MDLCGVLEEVQRVIVLMWPQIFSGTLFKCLDQAKGWMQGSKTAQFKM